MFDTGILYIIVYYIYPVQFLVNFTISFNLYVVNCNRFHPFGHNYISNKNEIITMLKSETMLLFSVLWHLQWLWNCHLQNNCVHDCDSNTCKSFVNVHFCSLPLFLPLNRIKPCLVTPTTVTATYWNQISSVFSVLVRVVETFYLICNCTPNSWKPSCDRRCFRQLTKILPFLLCSWQMVICVLLYDGYSCLNSSGSLWGFQAKPKSSEKQALLLH